MIEMIQITNFKSLGEVTLELGKFNCLIGMNGAGKSTVLQALDFLSQLMLGDVSGWLDQRGWQIGDLNCKLRKESNITFEVYFKTATGDKLMWEGAFNRTLLRCTSELIVFTGTHENFSKKYFQSNGTSYFTDKSLSQSIAFNFQGSLLSALKDTELPAPVLEFRDALRRIRSLELLSPHLLRKRARAGEDIGVGGEKLSAYLDTIRGEAKVKLVALLQTFYPALTDFKVKSLRSGSKQLLVIEHYGSHRLETEATHLNDGLLRILAVLAQSSSDRSMILLDEIENGINQEIVEKLTDLLVASPQQMLVTTHSPLVLNYLEDDVAREAVQFIYKTPQGESRIRRFFDIPRMGEKLSSMGPGDAVVDTDLHALTQECMALDNAPAAP